MENIFILQGFIAGVIISLPKGPAGLFVIQQNIAHGPRKGFLISLGLIATTLVSSFILLFLPANAIAQLLDHAWVSVLLLIILILIGKKLFKEKNLKLFTTEQNGELVAKYLFIATFFAPDVFPLTVVIFNKVNQAIFFERHSCRFYFLLGIGTGAFGWYILLTFVLWLQSLIKRDLLKRIFELAVTLLLLKLVVLFGGLFCLI